MTIRPSTWFLWHGHPPLALGRASATWPAARVSHSLAAAARGPAGGRASGGAQAGHRLAGLEEPWPELGTFDAVLVFNYLDRAKMPQMIELVEPGSSLMQWRRS